MWVEAKCDFFSRIGVWPERNVLDPHSWLLNFPQEERVFATSLLNAFMYFNEPLIDALFRSAVQSLSAELTARAPSLAEAKGIWRSFLSTVIVTYVEGERPHPTDSGLLFARKARQVLRIEESQIASPLNAIAMLLRQPRRPILFVDDFVGSGSQMSTTWTRPYKVGGETHTFKTLSRSGARMTYTPLIATTHGLMVLRAECPGLLVRPAHSLDESYNLLSKASPLWPRELKESARDFLLTASSRAGLVDSTDSWQGFNGLGLGLGFVHSTPDATLPLFYSENNGWRPLLRRT